MIAAWLALAALWLSAYEAARTVLARRGVPWPTSRRLCWAGSALLLASSGLLARDSGAGGSLWVETLQFSLIAFGAAPLAVLAAPVELIGTVNRLQSARALQRGGGAAARVGAARAAAGGAGRARFRVLPARAALAALLGYVAVTVAWRLPPLVDALARHRFLLVVEVLSVLGGTWWLWVSILGSPPWPAVEVRPLRVVLAMAAAWSVWIFAYAVGFSGRAFYAPYGSGRGAVSAQEWSVIVLFATSLVPCAAGMYSSLVRWLSADQTIADAESTLHRQRNATLLAGGVAGQRPGGAAGRRGEPGR